MTIQKDPFFLDPYKKNLTDWYLDQLSQLQYPIYSSYDIRFSGYKVAPVDANIYPAGFNNIHPANTHLVIEAFDHYIKIHFGNIQKILLITEEHTQNKFYWDNIFSIKKLIQKTGRHVQIAFPGETPSFTSIESAHHGFIPLISSNPNSFEFKNFNPDLIISNNDFSIPFHEWASEIQVPITPPRELGWYQRKKSLYFEIYNNLVFEFAKLIEKDPFYYQVETKVFENFVIDSEDSQKQLAQAANQFINQLELKYKQKQIPEKPVLFIKNNAGTYGLAVTQIQSGDDILNWTYSNRKKMKAAKGGRKVTELILQEGISSQIRYEQAIAEPVYYMVGCKVVGGFLRYHRERGVNESLNTPGSQFFSFPIDNPPFSNPSSGQENIFSWGPRLGLLALGLEAKAMGIEFKSFQKKRCDIESKSSFQSDL